MANRRSTTITILLSFAVAFPVLAAEKGSALLQQGEPRSAIHDQTGKLRFLGADPATPISLPAAMLAGLTPEDRGRAILQVYGPDFGLREPSAELRLLRETPWGERGGSVRYQQTYRGVPVLAGELIVNTDARGRLLSISGEISPDLTISTQPSITADQAAAAAQEAVAQSYGLGLEALQASDPTLWIYDERLLLPSRRPAELVWRTEVTAQDLAPIRELVLVNAHRGGISLHFNQIDTTKNRVVYDNANNSALGLPGGGPYRTEGGPPSGIGDVNLAYDYAGHTYDFYLANHGRDSVDGAGMTLISTTRYCPSVFQCPYPNAFWHATRKQMVYGDGYASADDVVGHEMTHGVTQFESYLFYYYQSGAINESFSDLWGEFVDLTNGAGNDAPGMRWLLGEDLPGGAIRNFQNPPAYSDPDKMTSLLYKKESGDLGDLFDTYDNGGVHTNSGVNNKAVYLMTDGDTFNGETVTGLGIAKVAAIYYRVQTTLLTSGADYADLYQALYQACLVLIGSAGITASDCQEVRDATDAVEMNLQPVSGFNAEAEICPSGQWPVVRFIDDLEAGASQWTFGVVSGTSAWRYDWPYIDDYAHSGLHFLNGNDRYASSDSYVQMSAATTPPSGAFLHFAHAYGFDEPNRDGGVVEYSAGGGLWTDAGALFEVNGYDGTIPGGYGNPLAGRSAFLGDSHGYISSRLNLSSLAGQSVRFRWRLGTSSSGYDLGWLLDDVRLYSCTTNALFLPLIRR